MTRLSNKYREHYFANLKLATPIVIAQAGQISVSLIDTLMVGHVGVISLAAASFANSIFINVLVFGLGVSYALTPLVGKAFGEGDHESCRSWMRHGLAVNMLVGVILTLAAAAVAFLMPHLGQSSDVVNEAVPYYMLLVLSLIPFQVFSGFKQFSEGISNTKIAMIIMVAGNALNISLNFVFIYGYLGIPAMGLFGAGLGTLLSRIFMAILFIWAFNRNSCFSPYRQIMCWNYSRNAFMKLVKLGVPIGLHYFIEVFIFSIGGIMIGWTGAVNLAAHQIVYSLTTFTFMISAGLGTAATIRISIFKGQKNYAAIGQGALASLRLVLIFMGTMSVLFVLLKDILPKLFIIDSEVVAVAANLIIIASLFQIFDGIQIVTLGVLRGIGDVNVPALVACITYLMLSIPVGCFFAFVLEMGAAGIWMGYLAGFIVVSVFLFARLRWVYERRYGCGIFGR